MELCVLRPFALSDTEAVIDLWQRCELTRSWNDPHKDIQRKMDADPAGFWVAEWDHRVVGSLMVGYDGHRGWANYLAVLPEFQSKGLGKALMARAEALLIDRGCSKLNLQIRLSNKAAQAFYESIGYRADEVVSLGKRLLPDA